MLALIVGLAVLAQVGCEYHYQQPSPFQLPNQQNSPVGSPNNQHYSQGIVNNFQHSYANSQNVNYQHFSNNQVQSPNPAKLFNHYHGVSQNVNSANSQTVQQTNINSINLNSISAAPAQPIVKKHIYFHVPPPDVEASVVPTSYKKKKIYNIVFIKVPSQQPTYYTNSQGVRINPYVPAEDKTIIYVLVKNPEDFDQSRVRSPPNHEVYYVKYKGSANSAASKINNQVTGVTPVHSLRPGLVNGQE